MILGHYLTGGETGELITAPGRGFNEDRKGKNSCKGQQNDVKSPGVFNELWHPDLLCSEALCNYGIRVVNLIRNSDNNHPNVYLVLGD